MHASLSVWCSSRADCTPAPQCEVKNLPCVLFRMPGQLVVSLLSAKGLGKPTTPGSSALTALKTTTHGPETAAARAIFPHVVGNTPGAAAGPLLKSTQWDIDPTCIRLATRSWGWRPYCSGSLFIYPGSSRRRGQGQWRCSHLRVHALPSWNAWDVERRSPTR